MVRLAYNLLLIALAPLAVPYWALRGVAKGRAWKDVLGSLGWLPSLQHTTAGPSVWFHAVSVGEMQSALALLRALRRSLPDTPLYVSAGTATGLALAREKLDGVADTVLAAPLDLPWCVARFFRKLRPRLLIVAETEIWPNYFFQAKRFGTATLIVNGRISDRSAPKYRALRGVFRPVLRSVDAILAQSDVDRDRFVAAGAAPGATRVGGNLKYDFDSAGSAADLPAELARFLDDCAPNLLFVAGSTREREESFLAPSLRAIAERVPRCLLAVAPRHPHRFEEAENALRELALPLLRRSRIGPAASPSELPAVLLLDSLGELASLYARADLVFVGGSLNGWGGHNVLEPVLYGKPVVVGPHMQNFRQITADLRGAGGLVQVTDRAELPVVLSDLAGDAAKRQDVGRTGQDFAQSQRGASNRAIDQALRLFRRAMPRRPPSFFAALVLGAPAALWTAAAGWRRRAYESGALGARSLDLPVISVGNLVAGGTGKTPTVAWLVEHLLERGLTAAVLTRGYGREETSRMRILPASVGANPREVGDEPAMLADRFARTAPRTVIGVCADRLAAGRTLETRDGIDLFVLDDGFQHLQLRRTVDIVLLDASEPFGNGHALPLGRLREPVASLRHASIVLLTRCRPDFDYARIRAAVRGANREARIFHSRMVATGLVDLATRSEARLDAARGARVAAFCGIANPQSFFEQVRGIGSEIVLERSFRDHHAYTTQDVRSLARAAKQAGAQAILTTTKDAMKLGHAESFGIPVFAVGIELEVESWEEMLACVLDALPEPCRRLQGRMPGDLEQDDR